MARLSNSSFQSRGSDFEASFVSGPAEMLWAVLRAPPPETFCVLCFRCLLARLVSWSSSATVRERVFPFAFGSRAGCAIVNCPLAFAKMGKLRISIVEFLNTAPLVWGFTDGPLAGRYDLSFAV